MFHTVNTLGPPVTGTFLDSTVQVIFWFQVVEALAFVGWDYFVWRNRDSRADIYKALLILDTVWVLPVVLTFLWI
ncbi:MAG: hypothetical protein RL197_583 [Actinomycetota bacterium]